jgi:hypothetical protein
MEFDTEEPDELAAQTPTFDTNLLPLYNAHVKVAEANIKAWRLRVRQVMKTALCRSEIERFCGLLRRVM